MPKAKSMIRDFLQNFAEMNSKNSGDEIYQISIQFFPLTDDTNKKDQA